MKQLLFKKGDIVFHKANSSIKVVILKPKVKIFNQKYCVCWYDGGEFHTGGAFEQELEKLKLQ